MRTPNAARKTRKVKKPRHADTKVRENGETLNTTEHPPRVRMSSATRWYHSVNAERRGRKVKVVNGAPPKIDSNPIFSREECFSLRRALHLESKCLTGSVYPAKAREQLSPTELSPVANKEVISADLKRQDQRPLRNLNDVDCPESVPHEEISPAVYNFVLPMDTPSTLRKPRFKLSLPPVPECDEEQCSF